MQKTKYVLGVSAIAVLLAACSPTANGPSAGGGSTPPQTPLKYSALTLNAQGVKQSTGTFTHNGATGSVQVDGQTYALTNGTQGGLLGTTQLAQYGYTVNASDVGMAIVGQHARAVTVYDASTGVHQAVGGNETTTLPTQTAVYDGYWQLMSSAPSSGRQGGFTATADFNANSIAFDISDTGGTAIGSGSGALHGTGFTSSFNTTGAYLTSTNQVTGQFYGPTANEMAGLIQGTSGGNDTAGLLIGQKR